jgi:hypothetical protein
MREILLPLSHSLEDYKSTKVRHAFFTHSLQ